MSVVHHALVRGMPTTCDLRAAVTTHHVEQVTCRNCRAQLRRDAADAVVPPALAPVAEALVAVPAPVPVRAPAAVPKEPRRRSPRPERLHLHWDTEGRTACSANGPATGSASDVTCRRCHDTRAWRAVVGQPVPAKQVHWPDGDRAACHRADTDRHTDDPAAVTCRPCRTTAAWRHATGSPAAGRAGFDQAWNLAHAADRAARKRALRAADRRLVAAHQGERDRYYTEELAAVGLGKRAET